MLTLKVFSTVEFTVRKFLSYFQRKQCESLSGLMKSTSKPDLLKTEHLTYTNV